LGITVLRRSALEHVADVHVLAAQGYHLEKLIQKGARCTDEGLAPSILVKPRRFTNEHDVRVLRSGAWDSIGPGAVKGTLGANPDCLVEIS
jgi:hypothetical protein